MTAEEIRQAVIDIIEELADDDDLSELDDNIRIREQVDLDSMDFLDIIMELRKRYGVKVPEEDYMKLSTMQGCIDYLQPLLADK
ncbi:MAG: acyl carrier protein [bacterium]|nr:acyl carrier protein [bacterium]